MAIFWGCFHKNMFIYMPIKLIVTYSRSLEIAVRVRGIKDLVMNFVESTGVDFYLLGGDPHVLAGYTERDKGLVPSSLARVFILKLPLRVFFLFSIL